MFLFSGAIDRTVFRNLSPDKTGTLNLNTINKYRPMIHVVLVFGTVFRILSLYVTLNAKCGDTL